MSIEDKDRQELILYRIDQAKDTETDVALPTLNTACKISAW